MPAENLNGNNEIETPYHNSALSEGIFMILMLFLGAISSYFWPQALVLFLSLFLVSCCIFFFLPGRSFYWILAIVLLFDFMFGAGIQKLLYSIINLG